MEGISIMNGIHIINKLEEGSNTKRRGMNIITGSQPIHFKSGIWDPISMGFKNVDEVRYNLVGGMVFFHNTKTSVSFVGGLVLEIDEVLLEEEGKRDERFEITFQSMIEGKGQKWRGKNHTMGYNSGLIEINN